MRRCGLFTGLALLIMASVAQAQESVDVQVSLSPSEMPFYKSATYTVTITAPETADVELPDLRPQFEALQMMTEESPPADYLKEPIDGGRVRIIESYQLEPVFVRDYFFDPVVLTVNGESIIAQSPALRVRELTEAEQEAIAQFHSELPGGPEATPRPVTSRWQFWVLGTVLAIAIVAMLVYWWITRRTLMSIEPPKLPWETALARLESLAARDLAKQGKYEAYFVDLSSILRYYIEGRFALHAPERTTPEFLAEMMETDLFTKQQEDFLKTFLRLCDRVKFAQHEPGMIDMEESFTKVRAFVEETIPREEDPVEAAA